MEKKKPSRMQGLSADQKIQKRLVENITLLWAMCEVPDHPKENELHGSGDEGRTLSLDREKQLVDSFAFLSASTDNMHRVMAVCIEERLDPKGMTVRLASNTGDLAQVTQGFDNIARILEQASSRSMSRTVQRQDLFRQVVILDEPRILSRLRSKHATRTQKTRGKPELLSLLNQTVHHKTINMRGDIAQSSLIGIRSSAVRLSQKFADFEVARDLKQVSYDALIDVLIQVSEFDVGSLQTALNSSLIDTSLKISLPLAVSKLGRYYQITCDLIDAARGEFSTLFRDISVHAINKPVFDMGFLAGHSAGFEETFKRTCRSSHQHRQASFEPSLVSTVREKFQTRMANRATAWKVHAEIQILLFYEENPHGISPRIIGSSKSACYLCNLFVQKHGKFQVPRTHGRLYDRWILPGRPLQGLSGTGNLRSATDRFNSALEARIISIVREKQLPFAHPAESVLTFRRPWVSNSTLSNISTREINDIDGQPPLDSIQEPREIEESHPIASLHSLPAAAAATAHEAIPGNLSTAPDPGRELPLHRFTTFHNLEEGQSVSHKLAGPMDDFTVETPTGIIHISWDVSSQDDSTSTHLPSNRACWVKFTWPASDVQSNQAYESTSAVDIQSLIPNQDHVVEEGSALSSEALVLKFKGCTLLVKYSFEDPEDHQISETSSGKA
ncbi:MAG: hypothetical protein Q9168_004119 [Polycauliona sp. 1 TL-2023]